jgi:hypothetical protein
LQSYAKIEGRGLDLKKSPNLMGVRLHSYNTYII